ncbi:EAL domain-containing protein [Sulfurimonas sp. MAG313]|nr:EAL domain-containing protein [Sulfurimonas sp. MAG313]MDF1881529.1 EAL domain-containing protein [Sulfurimonas sp. MAG313]
MSLFKQITFIMSLFLLVIFTSVIYLNFQSAKKYAQEEMSNNAQNTATYLSLSLAKAQGGTSEMSTMINAIFDSGYFQSIRLVDTKDTLIYGQNKETETSNIPKWFLSLYTFQTTPAIATVSSGWNPIGSIQVIPLQDTAHQKLYTNFLNILQSFALISLFSFTLLFFTLRLILSSLKRLTTQAEAVSNNNFIINEHIPKTQEFKEVTLAMNKMVEKVKNIFEREAKAVQEYHDLLYTDPLTKLSNRNFIELKLNDLLSSQEADASGCILTVYLEGMVQANKDIGHEKVNQLIQEIAKIIFKEIQGQENAFCARTDGSKFCLIFPSTFSEDIQELCDNILAQCLMHLEKASLHPTDTCIKLIITNYSAKDTNKKIFSNIQEVLDQAKKDAITDLTLSETQDYALAKSLIENRMKENSIALALQDVFDNDNNILHSEAYVRLLDDKKNVHEAVEFIPLVHKMKLDTRLDKNVINYALKEPSLDTRSIAINLSLRFLQDQDSTQWLKERLAGIDKTKVLNFEISNHNVLSSLSEAFSFSDILRSKGHNFGIDRFSIEEGSNLNYLQMIKPSYLKIDANYLLGMLQGKQGQKNNALQILIESLDIKIIASNIETKEHLDGLKKAGIKYFQGSYLAKPKLV